MDLQANAYSVYYNRNCSFTNSRKRVVVNVASRRALLSAVTLLAPCTRTFAAPEPPKFRKTPSGLKIQEVLEGYGPEAHEGQTVEFNYVCRRSNGYYVYSTMDLFNKDNHPVTFTLGEGKLVKGLEEVIMGMKAGGKRRALIPPEMGYTMPNLEPQPQEFGPRRSLMAHAKEALVFEVQLVKIE